MNTRSIIKLLSKQEVNTDIYTEYNFDGFDLYAENVMLLNNKQIRVRKTRIYDDYSGKVSDRIKYTMIVNKIEVYNPGLLSELFIVMSKLSCNYASLVAVLFNRNKSDSLYGELANEIKERIEEFEVIKDYKIDYISLESFYDYYKWEFNKEQFDKAYANTKKAYTIE